jgi:phospholipase/carboxylesterase
MLINHRSIKHLIAALAILMVFACTSDEPEPVIPGTIVSTIEQVELPERDGTPPATTSGVPHQQIGVDPVPEVNDELFRRVFSIPGVESQPSVVAGWDGIWVSEQLEIMVQDAIIGEREFGHIHHDGSLHIFLEPDRAIEAIKTGWAVAHPYAVQRRDGWEGFVMLYTPQSIVELNVTFQLIVDSFNYVTGQELIATDYYD